MLIVTLRQRDPMANKWTSSRCFSSNIILRPTACIRRPMRRIRSRNDASPNTSFASPTTAPLLSKSNAKKRWLSPRHIPFIIALFPCLSSGEKKEPRLSTRQYRKRLARPPTSRADLATAFSAQALHNSNFEEKDLFPKYTIESGLLRFCFCFCLFF